MAGGPLRPGDGPLTPPTPIGRRVTVDVAFVVPRSGPAGIYGPSCEACGTLAVEEVNAAGGLLGRQVRLRVVDGGRTPDTVAAEVDMLVGRGEIDAVAGWHGSAVRRAIDPVVSDRVPYFYSPLYEGGERTPGVFLTGETPERQLVPALRWMADELGVARWFVVGSDDAWPRASTRVARSLARRSPDVRVLGEVFVPPGTRDFDEVVRRALRSGTQGVLIFLVGSDAVAFHRVFARADPPRSVVRLSPLMDENMLLAIGSENAHELYAVAGFFAALATPAALDFATRYARRFGPSAPVLNSLGESCYEGLALFGRLVVRAGSLQPARLTDAARSLAYVSPRGRVRMEGNQLLQRVYLARADGLRLAVLAELPERPVDEG
ncbi:substrate-binding domain-containing protein [Pseudonocardia saturnea]